MALTITRPSQEDIYAIRNGTPDGLGRWDRDTIDAAKIAALERIGDNTAGGGGGGSTPEQYVGSTPAQLTVGTTSSVAVAASASFRKVCIYNNSVAVLTIAIGATPVSDTGTIPSPNFDGYGTQIFPGGFYASDPCKEVVNIIASAASSKATVTLFTAV